MNTPIPPPPPAAARDARSAAPRPLLRVLLEHLKVARLPLLILVLGGVLTFRVDQVRELFFLLVTASPWRQRVAALLTAFLLGLIVWHSTRILYRFADAEGNVCNDPRLSAFRTWTPRVLGALVPLFMALGYWLASRLPSVGASASFDLLPLLFIGESLVLFGALIARRRVARRLRRHTPLHPREDPILHRWSQVDRQTRSIYVALIIANILALVAAAYAPGHLAAIGPLALILLSAAFLTATGTYILVHASRIDFPLVSGLLVLAVVLQIFSANDNHRVRLYPGMDSTDEPDWSGKVHYTAPIDTSFEHYAEEWIHARPEGAPIYLVSAEGGGIRAAAWTALVLAQLDRQSGGQFSRSMLAGSGVSGGSVGLSLYAAILKGEASGQLSADQMVDIVQRFSTSDYLSPTLEAMLLSDFLQRFVPGRVFIDRGQRLEMSWERSWNSATGCAAGSHYVVNASIPAQTLASAVTQTAASTAAAPCDLFAQPWSVLWQNKDPVPALFLNSTIVQTGQRFVQHPFHSLSADANEKDTEVLDGGLGSNGWIPGSAPLSAVAHNSARFTYVSPAGTLLNRSQGTTSSLQLVDGGYFENSATTTLAELARILAKKLQVCDFEHGGWSAPACPIRFIHISNDPNVETILGDDHCANQAGNSTYGDATAPLIALLNTREARGAYARSALRHNSQSMKSGSGPHFFHFRLCAGEHPLPLGWTLSTDALSEMKKQLCSGEKALPNARFNRVQLDQISPPAAGAAAKDVCSGIQRE